MRRLDLLIDDIRNATENDNPTSGSGIIDNDIIRLLNKAQRRLFSIITSVNPEMFFAFQNIDTVVGTETYTLNTNAYLGGRVIMVEWLAGDTDDYVKLEPKTIHSRWTNDNGTPLWYMRTGNTLYINPRPSEAKTNGLRVTYQKRPRALDIRRGYVTTATIAAGLLTSLTLTNPSTLDTRDADLDTAAGDILKETDFICVVDKDGASVLDTITVKDYNTSTRVLTMKGSGFATTLAAATIQNNYIVAGKYATDTCELPDDIEEYLLTYVELFLLTRDGNSSEAKLKSQELVAIEADIKTAFANDDLDIFITPIDECMSGDGEY